MLSLSKARAHDRQTVTAAFTAAAEPFDSTTVRACATPRCRQLQHSGVPHVTTTRSGPGSSIAIRYAYRRAVVRRRRDVNTPVPSRFVGPVHGQHASAPPERSTRDQNRSYVD